MDMDYGAERNPYAAGDYNVSSGNETLKRPRAGRDRSVRKTSFFKAFALPH
jgi:hypothetical protein